MTLQFFRSRTLTASALLALALFTAACSKHTPIPPPPPGPKQDTSQPTGNGGAATSTRPTATLNAEPSRFERGQEIKLTWLTTNANDVSISNGVGTVGSSGTVTVSPVDTTTYTLTANGPNGTATATAVVTLVTPAPAIVTPPVRPNNPMATFESRVQSDLKDALFDYDSVNIREDARAALTADAEALKHIFVDFPNSSVNVEGHCDERGSAEYNLGLGDRRASSARDLLVQLGVPAARLHTISYGKERPQCTDATEACYQLNRRAHISAGQ